jgi:formylglycine-generating enzyme required for sulfatase activity
VQVIKKILGLLLIVFSLIFFFLAVDVGWVDGGGWAIVISLTTAYWGVKWMFGITGGLRSLISLISQQGGRILGLLLIGFSLFLLKVAIGELAVGTRGMGLLIVFSLVTAYWGVKWMFGITRGLSSLISRPWKRNFCDTLKSGKNGPELVWIPPGNFMMGSPKSEPQREFEEIHHKVILTEPFAMGRSPVTVDEFRQFVDESGYHWEKSDDQLGDRHPVLGVSHDDAVAYVEWLIKETGKDYALPTEAQWEYACRAGTTTAYSFGNDASQLGDYGWYSDNSGGKTHPVASKKPNPWGLYDMHGNVNEWTADWYETYLLKDHGQTITRVNSGSYRVVRGGGWYDGARLLRSAYRVGISPGARSLNVGFRLLLRTP